MTIWSYCPRCSVIYDEFELRCSGCSLTVQDIRRVEDHLTNNEVVEFMTTGTDPRLAPRSDSG